jgi:hypothetical protein
MISSFLQRPIFQYAWVVNDLDAGERRWAELFGAGQLHDETPSIFREMFKPGEEGFHHVGILSEDFAADRQHFLDRGLDLAVEMWSGADVCYFDARKQIGCFVEMHGDSQIIREIFSGWKSAHDGWDGRDPVREPNGPRIEKRR